MKVIAPGKIILSGEHAVVYGSPAIAVAVDHKTKLNIVHNNSENIILRLLDLNICSHKKISQLQTLLHELDQKFIYKTDDLPLLSNFCEMYWYGIASFFHDYDIKHASITITLSSKIPFGSGMGSSASTLCALYLGLYKFFAITIDNQILALQVSHAERLQHACISKIDANVIVYGGVRMLSQNNIVPLEVMFNHNWYLIDSGVPDSITGVCVAQVREHFGKLDIWKEFTKITLSFEQALLDCQECMINKCIQKNHKLLYKIGVVPIKVNSFINELQKCNISAKISGAGSISGNRAGLLLAYINDNIKNLSYLCKQYGYIYYPLIVNYSGVHCCD